MGEINQLDNIINDLVDKANGKKIQKYEQKNSSPQKKVEPKYSQNSE